MRKNYIDNLRWISILLLFPYHTFRVFSCNDKFYVQGDSNSIMSVFVYFCIPWFMSLLFVIAGMSTAYALKKRSVAQYALERVKKLLIPFISGLVLIIPLQTYYANKFYNGFDGSIIEQYRIFFTKITDMSGYDGGMTPGHLWFILFLFLISLIAIIPIKLIKKNDRITGKINIVLLLLLGILVYGMNFIGNSGGKSLGKYFTLFFIGYYVLSEDRILEILKKRWLLLLGLWTVLETAFIILNIGYDRNVVLLEIFSGWIAILALLGIGQRILNFANGFAKYMSASSFPVYIFHQTILVAIAFYVIKLDIGVWTMATIICLGTVLTTFLAYEIIKRIPGVRSLFGIRGVKHGGQKN